MNNLDKARDLFNAAFLQARLLHNYVSRRLEHAGFFYHYEHTDKGQAGNPEQEVFPELQVPHLTLASPAGIQTSTHLFSTEHNALTSVGHTKMAKPPPNVWRSSVKISHKRSRQGFCQSMD